MRRIRCTNIGCLPLDVVRTTVFDEFVNGILHIVSTIVMADALVLIGRTMMAYRQLAAEM